MILLTIILNNYTETYREKNGQHFVSIIASDCSIDYLSLILYLMNDEYNKRVMKKNGQHFVSIMVLIAL